MKSGKVIDACHELIRSIIDHAEEDRLFANDLEKAAQLISSKDITNCARKCAQENNIDLNGKWNELFSVY